jgi:two-component system chemotaxis response regulator CheY
MKALVVDDSKVMRIMLSNVLKDVGFTDIAQAEHGKAGLEYLTRNPDTRLALVDWNMPEMTGIEMVEAVRKNDSLRRVNLIMVTTESETEQISRAVKLGADEYVTKPFTKEVIAGKLQKIGLEL